MTAELPEVTGYGLLLWRSRRQPDQELLCQAGECAGGIALVIRELSTGAVLVVETYTDVVSLLVRAERLRKAYADISVAASQDGKVASGQRRGLPA